MSRRTYLVAQLGARMHYAVPRILQEFGQLEKLYTDICAVQGWPKLLSLLPRSLRPTSVNRLLSRIPRGINPGQITAFNNFGYEYAKRRNLIAREGRFRVHLWAGEEFCRRILNAGFGRAGGVYAFNSAGLEVLRQAKKLGLFAVSEQTIAPMRMELELLDEEENRFSGWEATTEKAGATDYCDREEEEWNLADLVLCGSDFVRDGIKLCGGSVEKCVVVPYGVDLPKQIGESGKQKVESGAGGGERRTEGGGRRADDGGRPPLNPQPSTLNRPLRVLTAGTVGLRKGSPYVMEAAKQLKGRAVFRMAGSIGVTHEAERQLREFVELTGSVPRSEVARHFEWADVFLLPSLCEGSATVTYEALGHGLPVVCTPNTGSVVRDSVDGFIVPIRNVAAIAARLEQLANDDSLRNYLSANARQRAGDFTVATYGRRLLAALDGHVGPG